MCVLDFLSIPLIIAIRMLRKNVPEPFLCAGLAPTHSHHEPPAQCHLCTRAPVHQPTTQYIGCVHMHQCISLQHNIKDVYTCNNIPAYNTIYRICTQAPAYNTFYRMRIHAPVYQHTTQYIECVHMHQCTGILYNI